MSIFSLTFTFLIIFQNLHTFNVIFIQLFHEEIDFNKLGQINIFIPFASQIPFNMLIFAQLFNISEINLLHLNNFKLFY